MSILEYRGYRIVPVAGPQYDVYEVYERVVRLNSEQAARDWIDRRITKRSA